CSLHLVHRCLILECRYVTNRLSRHNSLYNPTHDLSAPCLWKLRDKEDLLQGRDRPHPFPYPITKLAVEVITRLSARPQYHKCNRHLALQLVRYCYSGSLSNCRMLDQGRFQLICAQSVTGHFDHFVGSS